MGKRQYRTEVDQIRASEEFKQHTINRLLLIAERPDLMAEDPKPNRRRLPKSARRAAAVLALAAFGVVCWQFVRVQQAAPSFSTAPAEDFASMAPEAAYAPGTDDIPATGSAAGGARQPSGYFAAGQAQSLPPLPAATPEIGGAETVVSDYTPPDNTPALPETAPVYGEGAAALGQDTLLDIATEQAGALGLAVQSTTTTTDGLVADCGEAEIAVEPGGAVRIAFAAPVALSGDAASAVMQEYSELFDGMQQPVAETTGEGVVVYDAAAPEQGALAQLNAEGELVAIRLWREMEEGKLGDYPLRSLEDATTRLLAGEGITASGALVPANADEILSVDLVYLQSGEYELPYYRFFTALAGDGEEQATTAAVWYLPAVSAEFYE